MKPLQVVNEKLRQMRVGGKNEKIVYHERDEIGMLVKEYNEMVDKLEANVKKLARALGGKWPGKLLTRSKTR